MKNTPSILLTKRNIPLMKRNIRKVSLTPRKWKSNKNTEATDGHPTVAFFLVRFGLGNACPYSIALNRAGRFLSGQRLNENVVEANAGSPSISSSG